MDERQEQNLELLHGVNGFRESQRDMAEMQTADSSETDPRLSDLLKENAELKRTVETLNMQLHISKEELRVFGVEQVMWREQEALLKDKVSHYEKLVRADQGERVWRESERSERVPEETVHLQKAALSLQQVLKRTKQEIERETFKARETELQAKIQLLESQITELRETVDKPCSTESETIDGLVQSLENAELNFNKERAEWRKLRQELEDRATLSGSKVIALEKERDSLEETVALLKEELNQKDKASTTEAPDDSCCGQRAQELSRKVEEQQGNRVRLEAEGKGLERRAVEAEAKPRNDANPFQEQWDMVLEMQKHLSDLQKDHEALKATVGDLKGQRLDENETSRATEAPVHELRLQRQNDVTLREKDLMQQQESLEQEKEQCLKTVRELSEENRRIEAMLEDEREKTARLEENAEETALSTERMKQEFEKELERFQQREERAHDTMTELQETKERLEKNAEETELRTQRVRQAFQKEVKRFQQREVEANDTITQLLETKERLEKNAEETALRTQRVRQAFQKEVERLQQRGVEALDIITELLETKDRLEMKLVAAREREAKNKERKGFFHRVFRRSHQ